MGVGKSTFVFTKNSITLGAESTTINITRDNQSYSHKLVTKYGTIATLAVGTTSYTWTPTASSLSTFLAENTGQKTASITVTLYTYNGSTEVGWDAHFLTVTLSEADGKPTLSVTPTDTYGHITKYGGLVSGKSKLTVTATTSGKYGATVGKPSGSFAGQSYTGSPMTFIPQNDTTQVNVTNWNSLSIISWANLEGVTWKSLQGMSLPYTSSLSVKATDSRGFTSTYYKTYKILPYTAPIISNSDVTRCDSSGTLSLNGTYVKVTITYSISSLNSKNTKQLIIKYKSSTQTSWTSKTVTLSAYSGTSSTIISGFVAGTSYDFQLELKDDFVTYTDNTSIRTNGTVLEVDADGESLVIGDMYGYNVLLREDTIEIRKGIVSKLKITDSGLEYTIPNVSIDCNDVSTSGKLYIFVSNLTSSHYPIQNNGWLETMVYSSDTNYRFQRYTTYKGAIYERIMVGGKWGSWAGIRSLPTS